MTDMITDYDPAEDLDTPEAISVFVNEALQTDDAAYIAHALGVVARAKGMAALRGRRGFRANSFTGRFPARATRR